MGVNCLMKDFWKYWTRMKINEEEQKKQSYKPRNKIVFNWFQKINQLFMRINRLILSVVYKNTVQPVLRSEDREIHTRIYTGSLLTKATSNPQLTTENSYVINPRLQTPKRWSWIYFVSEVRYFFWIGRVILGWLKWRKNTHPLWYTIHYKSEHPLTVYTNTLQVLQI